MGLHTSEPVRGGEATWDSEFTRRHESARLGTADRFFSPRPRTISSKTKRLPTWDSSISGNNGSRISTVPSTSTSLRCEGFRPSSRRYVPSSSRRSRVKKERSLRRSKLPLRRTGVAAGDESS
jgi:hypothetical protein